MSFPKAAGVALRDSQLRRNLAKATRTIREKRAGVVGEVPDWAELRQAGSALKDASLVSLDTQLERLEAAVVAAGGQVHWANDGNEANRIVCEIAGAQGVDEVVKVKSILTDEIKLNEALADAGVRAIETDLSPHDLDQLDGALTGCALAIAETGVIVLDGGPAQGRRALTLVPDYHLCVVTEDQIVDLVTEAIERLEPAVSAGRPLTFIAGPSATSDVELNRVEGVHGPRTLHVVIAG